MILSGANLRSGPHLSNKRIVRVLPTEDLRRLIPLPVLFFYGSLAHKLSLVFSPFFLEPWNLNSTVEFDWPIPASYPSSWFQAIRVYSSQSARSVTKTLNLRNPNEDYRVSFLSACFSCSITDSAWDWFFRARFGVFLGEFLVLGQLECQFDFLNVKMIACEDL